MYYLITLTVYYPILFISYSYKLIQSTMDAQESIKRNHSRLLQLSCKQPLSYLLSALYYSAAQLRTYALSMQTPSSRSPINPKLFRAFQKVFQNYKEQDLSTLSDNQRQIFSKILAITNSKQFSEHTQNNKANRRYTAYTYENKITDQRRSYNLQMINKESDGQWQKVQLAYTQHQIDIAYKLGIQYAKRSHSLSQEQRQLIDTIRLQYNTMIQFYNHFQEQGWVLDREVNGIKLEYKVYEGQKEIAIRTTGEFQIQIIPFLAVISEIDLMGDYVPFCYDSKELKSISRNEKIGTSRIYIPLLTDRETYFYAAGYDRMKHSGSIFLYSKTINQDQFYQTKYQYRVPVQSEYVRLDYNFFIVEYKPLTKGKAAIRLASKVDMKLNFIPSFILHRSARIFAFDYFKNILQKTANYKGSKWEEKVKNNPALYQFFQKKVAQYLI